MSALTRQQIQDHRVPAGAVTLWWLGQAGWIIKSPGGAVLALDPYLSNSCKAIGDSAGFDMNRTAPAPMTPQDLLGIDRYVLTHSHGDHLDPETLQPYLAAGGKAPFVAPAQAAQALRALKVAESQIEPTWSGHQHTIKDVTLRTLLALPFGADDLTHVGYLLQVKDGPHVYFTGDTAFEEILFLQLDGVRVDVLCVVINGAFRNLSAAEAARLARHLRPRHVIPCHHDLFLDNSVPPQILRTNLKLVGLGEAYRAPAYGVPMTFTGGC